MVQQWYEEHQKWNHQLDIEVISYHQVCAKNGRKTTHHLRPEFKRHYDTLLIDEAHYLKGRNTSWAKALLNINSDRTVLATGTPIVNYADELFMLLRYIHPNDPAFRSYWKWVEQWFDIWKPQWGGTKVGHLRKGRSWEQFQQQNLGDRYLARTWDDVGMQLPELIETDYEVPMSDNQRKAYEELKTQYVTQLDNTGETVIAWNNAALVAQLMKVTTGLQLLHPQEKGSGKLELVAELLKEWRTMQVVMFCHFKSTAKALAQICDKLKIKYGIVSGDYTPQQRDELRTQFQNGECQVLIGTYGTMAEGWTLTRGHHAICVEHSWLPSKNKQAVRRLWRLGQQHPVRVIHLYTEDSVDDRIRTVLRQKTDQQMKALPAHDFSKLL